jgi:hypothetical protein
MININKVIDNRSTFFSGGVTSCTRNVKYFCHLSVHRRCHREKWRRIFKQIQKIKWIVGKNRFLYRGIKYNIFGLIPKTSYVTQTLSIKYRGNIEPRATSGGDIYYLFSICCLRMKWKNPNENVKYEHGMWSRMLYRTIDSVLLACKRPRGSHGLAPGLSLSIILTLLPVSMCGTKFPAFRYQ